LARGFECSFLELDAIGDALHLDVRQFPFQFPVHGELVDERISLLKAAHGTLVAKGLIDGRRFAPELEDTITTFARSRIAIALVGSVDGDGVCARAASDGRFAVLARERDEGIHFTPIIPTALVRSILGLLPAARPGPGRSVTITVDESSNVRHRAPEEDFAAHRYMRAVHPPSTSAQAQHAVVNDIMRRPRVGSGYFTVTARGRNGRDGDPLTMSWLDTDAGRYAVIPSTGHDGRQHITYTPADLARLEQSLSRLVELIG
jgi:EspG family